MNREEALKILDTIPTIGEQVDALEMAIEALEQEPTDAVQRTSNANKKRVENTLEDAISRQAALALAKEIHVPTGNAYVYYNHWCIDPQEIIELPPVTVAEKTGRWIHWASGDDCSECGWSTGRYIPTTKYCPNCGAKMEVEE